MTITRETLELAAKSAGLKIYDSDVLGLCVKLKSGQLASNLVQWRPHIDHGQLLDLAMACSMVIDNDNGQVLCYCERKGWKRYQSCPGDFSSLAEAIITAAAEQQLSKEKKE